MEDYIHNLYQHILDDIDHGIMYINRDDVIVEINQKAKAILGFSIDQTKAHPSGAIQPGDIVIIADSRLGHDDGGLTAADLKLINIHERHIKRGDMVIAIGVYDDAAINPVYKFFPSRQFNEDFVLHTDFQGHEIKVSISYFDKLIAINVNGTDYNMPVLEAVGHLVVIDSVSGQVKFYQERGYTLRGETIHNLLYGKPYGAKGKGTEEMDLRGQKIQSLIFSASFIDTIHAIIFDNANPIVNKIQNLDTVTTICSISPITINGIVDGVILKLVDPLELEYLLKIRNDTIASLEKFHDNVSIGNIPEIDHLFPRFIGNSNAIARCKYLAYKASKIHSNVIITGESGTGKSQLAYEIHQLYKKDAPFVEVNCSSIPETLFESELFGYVGGAFTGALSNGKAGYFEVANGGTIFLDEIGEIPLSMQVKLLQVLQNKRFYRVGSSKPITADIRVIAATNKDLMNAVNAGTFRQDLYYRLNVFPITIAPLRERKSDIHLLINTITARVCEEYHIPPKEYSGGALSKLLNYSWPGNVRELQNVIERAVTLAESDLIFPEYIDIFSEEKKSTLKDIVQETERKAIIDAIQTANGDSTLAMKSLGISRAGFYGKVKKYQIDL